MSSIALLHPELASHIWEDTQSEVEAAETLHEAAEAVLSAIYDEFRYSLALARAFVTLPYGTLPEQHRNFAMKLAGEHGVSELVSETTPVLSLVGTRGDVPDWNDIHASKGHLGIPLISESFINDVPMVARLLKDLGLTANLDSLLNGSAPKNDAPEVRTFYVVDAATSVDRRGRNIIPHQEFVRKHGIKTVFGGGGPYGVNRKNVLAFVFFTKETLDEAAVRTFEPLFADFQRATENLIVSGRIFA